MPEDLAAKLKQAVAAQAKVLSAERRLGSDAELAAEEAADVHETRQPAG